MSPGDFDADDVIISVDNLGGEFTLTLTEWMADGPWLGNRGFKSIKPRSTGEDLPPTSIPLAFRNDRESGALIATGRIAPPWRDRPWDAESRGPLPSEVGGPRAFAAEVADPGVVDGIAAHALSVIPPGGLDDRTVGVVLEKVPEIAGSAPLVVRRLAGRARWAEFDTVIRFAGAAGLADVGPVLCDVLDSDAGLPRPDGALKVLAELKFDQAWLVVQRMLARYVYGLDDLPAARCCLRALAVMGSQSRTGLNIISWGLGWPAPIPEWAAELLEATGSRIPSPFRQTFHDRRVARGDLTPRAPTERNVTVSVIPLVSSDPLELGHPGPVGEESGLPL